MTPTPIWHIHLGVHKTATTHIQSRLFEQRSLLRQSGAFYLPHNETRLLLQFRKVQRPLLDRLKSKITTTRRSERPFTNSAFAASCANALINDIECQSGDASRIIISEENLLGTVERVFNGHYFSTFKAIGLLRALSARRRLRVFLAIRTQDRFIPSAYVQALRTLPAQTLNFNSHVQKIRTTPPRWSRLVETISAHLPDVEIIIWNYDDYAANAQFVQEAIAGCPLPQTSQSGRPTQTRSPSAEAVLMAERLSESDPVRRAEKVAKIFGAHPVTSAANRFSPLSESDQTRLQQVFSDDLKAASKLSNVSVLSF